MIGVAITLLAQATVAAQPTPIAAPPPHYATDPFYARYLDAGGIPILSSTRTPDRALFVARDIVQSMLAKRPDIRDELIRVGFRVAIIATDESLLDLPEQRGWKKPGPDDPRLTRCERKHYAERIGALTDRQYWNARARGMGGLLTSAATENLLALPGDIYHGQNNFVHEMSHAMLRALVNTDPAFVRRVQAAYQAAIRKGLWTGEYASTNYEEYWAVGTQFWFDDAPVARFAGRQVLDDTDLAAYDPALYALLGDVFGGHHIAADAYWMSPARVPPGPPPADTAEVC